ncbi:MAG: RDD family protein [Bacteroidetes bacterium]|nr:RDD family protein [Bacteroidota bacterium]
MPLISIATPFHIDLELHTASIGKRGLAWIIDGVLLFLYELAFNRVVGASLPGEDWLRMMVIVGGVLLPVVLYHFLMEAFFNGQSIGKKLVGIRVVSMEGNAASISQYLIRLIFRSWFLVPAVVMVLLSLFFDFGHLNQDWFLAVAALLLLGATGGMLLYFLVNKNGQRIGDTLANTLVIEDRTKVDLNQTIFLELSYDHYQPRYPEVMRLTDHDINGIRNLLTSKRQDLYLEHLANRIAEVLKIETELPALQFLEQLLYDYNYLTGRPAKE